jgi:hypothetical protein
MTGSIVHDGCGALFRIRPVSHYVEPQIAQEKSCTARQAFRLRGIQDFDFHADAVRRPRVIRHTRDGIVISVIERAKAQPPDATENEQSQNYPAVATTAALYLRLFQSSTVSGKM